MSNRTNRARTVATALAGAAVLAAALPGLADAACPSSAGSHPFAAFGDEADYVPAPDGSFESGTPGWTLAGAAVTDGNESFAETGTHSLAIEAGGRAVSAPVCVSGEYPTFRFFARQLSGDSHGNLTASLRWMDLLGITVESPAGSVTNAGSWEPSPVMRLGDSMPLWLPASMMAVQLVFTSSGGGSWAIDDVYIDPYSR